MRPFRETIVAVEKQLVFPLQVYLDRFLGLQELKGPNISTQSAHESDKVLRLRHLPLYPQVLHMLSV